MTYRIERDNGAFPVVVDLGMGVQWNPGLTKRELFAAIILHARASVGRQPEVDWAVQQADELIKALNR